MDHSRASDSDTNKLTGIIIILVFIMMVVNEISLIPVKTDLHGIHDSLKFIGDNMALYIINSASWLINLVLLIGLSAAFLMTLRNFHNTLAHFIAFGIASTGLTIMVSTAGSLSLINITNEYLQATGIDSDIIAINGLSIAELRKNAMLISYTFFGLSISLLGMYILIIKHVKKWLGWYAILIGLLFAGGGWQDLYGLPFLLVRIIFIVYILIIGISFFKLSQVETVE